MGPGMPRAVGERFAAILRWELSGTVSSGPRWRPALRKIPGKPRKYGAPRPIPRLTWAKLRRYASRFRGGLRAKEQESFYAQFLEISSRLFEHACDVRRGSGGSCAGSGHSFP